MKKRVLYVEDNALNLRLVRKILQAAGYDVLEAMDGLTGVALAAAHTPDLILMDMNLPDIDGITATHHIKSNPQTTHIPVIALTANSMHGDRERFIAAGCDGYVPKPIAKNELLTIMSMLLSNRSYVSA